MFLPCRRLSLKSNKEEYAEKLSLEAFRLYRTVQSIIHTKEPDLVQHLTPCYSTLFEKNSNSSVSACWSLECNLVLFSHVRVTIINCHLAELQL
jgi:hypothetical protein